MSPGPAAASAVPDRLEGYAGAALDLDDALQRTGGTLQDALDRFAAQPSDVPVRLDPLGAELVALGRAAAQLDAWTGRVGVAFRLADRGTHVLRLLLSLLGLPFDPVRARPDWTDDEVAAALTSLLGLDPARAEGAIVQPLVDPDLVRAFVASLTPAQREALVEQHPELVGPVDGMPHELRYEANRALLDRALEQARALGDTDLVASLERLDGDDRQLLFFDPSGDGRVAEVFGDLATADDVVVFVPGVTNKLSNFGATRDNARHVYDEMGRLDPGGSHATIAWLGYDTPGLVDAPLPGRAHGAAPLLRQLWDGLALPDAVNTTVVGHSYGSLVSATALRDGFRGVDNLVVVGSPGLQAGDLDDLDLADGMRFFSARAPFDTLVGSTESYGRDPSDWRFGGTRFETGEHPGGYVTGHSAYTTVGSESLRNLARIGLGRFDAVTTIEPTLADRVVGGIDDVHDLLAEGPVDLLQWSDDRLDDLVHGGIDRVQDTVPLGPLDDVVDGLQDGFEAADRYGDAAVDAVQRVTSPDFWGDVVGDWFAVDGPGRLWDAGTDLVDAGLDRGRDVVDAGLEQGERVVDAAGEVIDAGLDRGRELLDDAGDVLDDGLDRGRELVDGAGDALDRGVDEAGDALEDLYDGTLGRLPGL